MRGRDKKKILNKHSRCVYCGGGEKATTIDHLPSLGTFVGRKRPPGLFIPSCEFCNQRSSALDDFGALLGAIKLYPSDSDMQHFSDKVRAMANNHPDVLAELVSKEENWRTWPIFMDVQSVTFGKWAVDGPIVSKLALQFGAKCALALHFNERHAPLPKDGKVGVMWFTNAQNIEGNIPQQLFDLLPGRRSLGLGKVNTLGTFEYNSGATTDGDGTAHWVTFGESFMYYLFAGTNFSALDKLEQNSIFSPGFMRNL